MNDELKAMMVRLQRATIAARARSRDDSTTIAVQVAGGKLSVVRVAFDARGTSTVTPVREGLSIDSAIEVLNALGEVTEVA